MGIQSSVNSMLGSVAKVAVAGKHLENQKKLNEDVKEIKENIRPQEEVEKDMKSFYYDGVSGKYTTDEALGNELVEANKNNPEQIKMESLVEEMNKPDENTIDWDSVNAEADAISARLAAERDPQMAERAINSMTITTQNKVERMDSVNQLHETLKQSGTVRPYVIIKGTGRAKKKYLD